MKKKSILSSVDQTELLALVGALQNKKVVVIGDVMLDVYIKGEVARISPEAPYRWWKSTRMIKKCRAGRLTWRPISPLWAGRRPLSELSVRIRRARNC